MKKGLILEGGGKRGIYTAGVLDVFLDNGIFFDGVIYIWWWYIVLFKIK